MSYAATVVFMGLALVGAVFTYVLVGRSLAAEAPAHDSVTGDFVWETNENTPLGDYFVDIQAVDEQGNTATRQVKITVLPAEQPQTPSVPDTSGTSSDNGGGGGDSGDGSGDGGGSDEEQRPIPRVLGASTASLTFQAESGHAISGSYSGVEPNKKTVVLAHPRAIFERQVITGRGDWWLEARLKHDRPGPVKMGVYLNGQLWKAVTLDKNDNTYHTVRVGLLRQFTGGTLRFGLLNDTYDTKDPTNADKDRNLHIDWWQLVADGEVEPLAKSRSPRTARVRTTRSAGWTLLPALNSYITQELGAEHVTFDIWQYYAVRLTVAAAHRASIPTEERLRSIMRFWQGVRPDRPRGEAF